MSPSAHFAAAFAIDWLAGDPIEIESGSDGAVSADGRIFGTYVHGIFTDDGFRHAFLAAARAVCDLAPAGEFAGVAAEREHRIDRLAAHVRGALDMALIHRLLGDA